MQRQFTSLKSLLDPSLVIVVSHFDMVAEQVEKTFIWLVKMLIFDVLHPFLSSVQDGPFSAPM